MKKAVRNSVFAVASGCMLVAGAAAFGGTWDPVTKKMNPAKGEAVAYDRSDCTAPGAVGAGPNGYFGFVDKKGVTYSSVGSFNDLTSCIILGPKTRVKLYQHTNFKGSTKEISNNEVDEMLEKDLSSDWNNRMSSIKVWTIN